MTYDFPFSQPIIELGGGNNPIFRPNVDIRPGPSVDLVVDINNELPLRSNEYGGVFMSYSLEHVSWRNVKILLMEVHRILKPGAFAVFVIPNLREQAKLLASKNVWTDSDICMLFGDQDYPGNTHMCGFSPEHALKILREVGFSDITVMPHPNCKTDMIVEAKKENAGMKNPNIWTREDRMAAFNRQYFDGGSGLVGGYAKEGYWDYPIHWNTFNKIMELKPSSVLEIGAARGYIIKRVEDAGIRAIGLEVSNHCMLTRVTNSLIQHDITETPWPIKDKEFDVIFSNAVLEHIPKDKLDAVVLEMKRVANRGLHGIDYGETDDGFDKTHCTLKPNEWWSQVMPSEHMLVNKNQLESGPISPPAGDGKVKLNIGSFTTMFHHGWINIDIHDLAQFADMHKYLYVKHDARAGLPFDDSLVDLILASHFLEHLSYVDGQAFLNECHRVMKPKAIIRVSVPDTDKLIQMYKNGGLSTFDEINAGCASSPTHVMKLWSLLIPGHSSIHDSSSIIDMMAKAGFNTAYKAEFRASASAQMLSETMDMFPDLSVYVEAIKNG